MAEAVQLEMSSSPSNSAMFPVAPYLNQTNIEQPTAPKISAFELIFDKVDSFISMTVLPISFFGLVSNPINMAVFSKLMDKDSVSVSLLGMAISDFLVCLTTFIGILGEFDAVQNLLLHFSLSPKEMGYLFIAFPNAHFGRVTLTISAFITVERCLCVAMPLKVKTIFTSKRCKVIVFFCFLISIVQSVPNYSAYRFIWRYFPPLNKSLLGFTAVDVGTSLDFTGPSVLAYFLISFSLIVISTVILIVVLNKKRQWRQSVTTTTSTSAESGQVSSKELRVIKMMVMVSSLFIICNIPTSCLYLAYEIDPSIHYNGSKKHLYFLLGFISIPAQTINSSVNILIYYYYSSSYNATFNKIFNIRTPQEKDDSTVTKQNK